MQLKKNIYFKIDFGYQNVLKELDMPTSIKNKKLRVIYCP